MGSSYRRRVALERRAAVAVASAAVLVAVLGRLPFVDDDFPLLLGLAALVVLIALGLAANAWFRPVVLPSVPARLRDRDVGAATKQVARGKPVDPPELQAAALGQTRRGLRITQLQAGFWPVMGSNWSLRIGEGGLADVFGYLGLLFMLVGAGVLVWSGVVQRRLDRLERAVPSSTAATTGTEGAERDRAS